MNVETLCALENKLIAAFDTVGTDNKYYRFKYTIPSLESEYICISPECLEDALTDLIYDTPMYIKYRLVYDHVMNKAHDNDVGNEMEKLLVDCIERKIDPKTVTPKLNALIPNISFNLNLNFKVKLERFINEIKKTKYTTVLTVLNEYLNDFRAPNTFIDVVSALLPKIYKPIIVDIFDVRTNNFYLNLLCYGSVRHKSDSNKSLSDIKNEYINALLNCKTNDEVIDVISTNKYIFSFINTWAFRKSKLVYTV